MGVLSLLTTEEIQQRSNSSVVKETEMGVLEFYRDLAEAILAEQNLKTTKSNYSINIGYAVLKLVEHLIIQDQENVLLAMAGPFSQERMGSYSYKIKQIEQQGWPPIIDRLIKMYRDTGDSQDLIITTRIFEEIRHISATGFRPDHDLLNRKFHEWEVGKPLP